MNDLLFAARLDPTHLAKRAGLTLDPWQARVLTVEGDVLLAGGRQVGKSMVAALIVVLLVATRPNGLALLIAPSIRQARELDRKIRHLLHRLDLRPAERTQLAMRFANGARIQICAADEDTIRGYSADLLVLDEASRIPEDVYLSVRPMLSTTGGRLVALSTPRGRRGWYARAWHNGGEEWTRVRIRADECPRISAAFLARERGRLPALWYEAEYNAAFVDSGDQWFSTEDIARAFDARVPPYQPRGVA